MARYGVKLHLGKFHIWDEEEQRYLKVKEVFFTYYERGFNPKRGEGLFFSLGKKTAEAKARFLNRRLK